MAWYRNKASPHLAPPDPTARVLSMPTDRERSISKWSVFYVGFGEDSRGGESRRSEDIVKYYPVSEGDHEQPVLLHDLL